MSRVPRRATRLLGFSLVGLALAPAAQDPKGRDQSEAERPSIASFAAVLKPGRSEAVAPRPLKEIARERLALATSIKDRLLQVLLSPPRPEDVKAAGEGRVDFDISSTEQLLGWEEQIADAKLDLAEKPADRVAAISELVTAMKRMEALMKEYGKVTSSAISPLDIDRVSFRRLQAETRLTKEVAAAPAQSR